MCCESESSSNIGGVGPNRCDFVGVGVVIAAAIFVAVVIVGGGDGFVVVPVLFGGFVTFYDQCLLLM